MSLSLLLFQNSETMRHLNYDHEGQKDTFATKNVRQSVPVTTRDSYKKHRTKIQQTLQLLQKLHTITDEVDCTSTSLRSEKHTNEKS